MSRLIGRKSEIKKLRRLLDSKRAEFLAIYGRRRIGKTFLVHEYFKDKGVYLEITGSKGAPQKAQLLKFHQEFSSVFSDQAHSSPPKDWGEAFYRLKEAVAQV